MIISKFNILKRGNTFFTAIKDNKKVLILITDSSRDLKVGENLLKVVDAVWGTKKGNNKHMYIVVEQL